MKNKFEGAIIIKQCDNRFKTESVYSLTFECREGSVIFDYLYKTLEFQSFVDSVINQKFNEEELELLETARMFKKSNDKLKEDIKVSKPKITIKIELEKYV